MSPHDPTQIHVADDEDPIARRLRRALAEEADMVNPDDRYEQITDRVDHPRSSRPWLPWVAGLAAAVVAGTVFGAVVLTGDDEDPTAAPGPTATQAEPSPPTTGSPTTTTTSAPQGTVTGVPVYWLGQSATRGWLFREFRDVPDVGGPVASAVAAMTRQTPLDPDYSTPWQPASRVEVSQDGQAITVDLSADAFSGTDVGSEAAGLAIQQLVHTATAAAQVAGRPATSVRITVDGGPADAWGVLRVGEPVSRAPQVEVQAPTWVTSPAEGATVPAGAVRFSGVGTAFEANFLWEVRDEDGTVVADGFTTGGGNGTYGEFAFAADLRPGRYTVEVYQPDESGGESAEGPRMYPDTKVFTVR